VEIPIHITLNITATGSFPPGGQDKIRKAVIDYANDNIKIGTNIIYADLFPPILQSVVGFVIVSMFIGKTENPTGRDNIDIAESEIGTFSSESVVINVK
jgi:hypothetical protein